MRRNLAGVLALAALALVPGRARAQNLKIGYVDVQRAITEVDEGKAATSRLKNELTAKRAELEKKGAEFQKMQADFEKQAGVLSDQAKKGKQEEMQRAYLALQNLQREAQEDLGGKEQEAMNSISKRMLQVVHELSQQEGFSFVFAKEVLLFAPGASDMTNEVVRRYNDHFGVAKAGGSKPAAGGARNPAPKAPPVKK